MKAIKDTMVLINLAKTTVLEISCQFLECVLIPEGVYHEAITEGKKTNKEDVQIIDQLIQKKRIQVRRVEDMKALENIYQFNVYGGEAEAIALYKQEKADIIITDDNNVRKKKDILGVEIIGSLGLLLQLRKEKKITKEKFSSVVEKLRTIGWFSSAVIDKVIMDGEKHV